MAPSKTAAKAESKAKVAKGKVEKAEKGRKADKKETEEEQVVEARPKRGAKAQKAEEEKTQPKAKNETSEEQPEKKVTKRGKKTEKDEQVPETSTNGTGKRTGKAAKKNDVQEAEEPAPKKGKAAKKTKKVAEEAANEDEAQEETVTKRTRKKAEKKEETTEKKPKASQPKKAKEPKASTSKTTSRKRKLSADSEPAKKPAVKNATVTNWAEINFECKEKNAKGEEANLHITSWNVDGIRAWLKKGGLEILNADKPDIFCIQETKCSDDKLPDELVEMEGYDKYWCASNKDGYAGVGIFTKIKPLAVTYGINDEQQDNEGRCITVEFEKFFLVNVYVPNAGRGLVTLPKRLDWNALFKSYVKDLDKKKPVIVCGDMNVAHSEIDLANPKTNQKNAGFTVEEREGMTDFLGDGYVDTFRKLYPDKEKAYTFWSYMSNARAKNVGWRLDYFIVSERFVENVCDNMIHDQVLGSDHCPISLHFNV